MATKYSCVISRSEGEEGTLLPPTTLGASLSVSMSSVPLADESDGVAEEDGEG